MSLICGGADRGGTLGGDGSGVGCGCGAGAGAGSSPPPPPQAPSASASAENIKIPMPRPTGGRTADLRTIIALSPNLEFHVLMDLNRGAARRSQESGCEPNGGEEAMGGVCIPVLDGR